MIYSGAFRREYEAGLGAVRVELVGGVEEFGFCYGGSATERDERASAVHEAGFGVDGADEVDLELERGVVGGGGKHGVDGASGG